MLRCLRRNGRKHHRTGSSRERHADDGDDRRDLSPGCGRRQRTRRHVRALHRARSGGPELIREIGLRRTGAERPRLCAVAEARASSRRQARSATTPARRQCRATSRPQGDASPTGVARPTGRGKRRKPGACAPVRADPIPLHRPPDVPGQAHPSRQAPHPHRDHVRPPEGRAPHRHSRRPMPQDLPPGRRSRGQSPLPAVSPDPGQSWWRRDRECSGPGTP